MELTWRVILPGKSPFNITYDRYSLFDFEGDTNGAVTTHLTDFLDDVHITSTLELTISNFSLNQTILECLIGDLDDNIVYVDVNSSGIILR